MDPDTATDDESLLARVAAGERDALATLYARYQRPLFGYVCHLTADRAVAEEILQDTLLAAWRGAGDFAARSSVRTWLFGIAHRQAHNRLRRRDGPPTALPTADLPDEHPDADPSPEDQALARATRADIAAALHRLSPTMREPLVLAAWQGLSYPEIAAILGIPVGTVKSRIHAAKRTLRPLLRDTWEGDG